MVFQATPFTVEVVIHAHQGDIPVVNTFHVRCGAAVSHNDLVQLTTHFHTWMVSQVFNLTVTDYVLDDITATDISQEGGGQYVYNAVATDHGSVATTAAPANAAAVISWRTARIGRSYRGRTYLGGLPMAYWADSHYFVAGAITGFTSAAQNLLTLLSAQGYYLGVLSRYLNKALRVVGLMSDIVGIVIDNTSDSQRRRTAN